MLSDAGVHKKINRKSYRNYANNYQTGLSQKTRKMHDACPPMLIDLRISVSRDPNDGESDVRSKEKQAASCLFSGDYLIIFFSQGWSKRKEKRKEVTSIQPRNKPFSYSQCKGRLQATAPKHGSGGPSLTTHLLQQLVTAAWGSPLAGQRAKACCGGKRSPSAIIMTCIFLFKHGFTFCYFLSPKHCSVGRVMDRLEPVFLSPRLQYFQPDTDILALHQEIQLWGHYGCILA